MLERIVAHIERLLEDRGWSKRRLACNMSMPKHRLERVLNKEEVPSRKKLKRIAEAFDVSVHVFFKPVKSSAYSRDKEDRYNIDNEGNLIYADT